MIFFNNSIKKEIEDLHKRQKVSIVATLYFLNKYGRRFLWYWYNYTG